MAITKVGVDVVQDPVKRGLIYKEFLEPVSGTYTVFLRAPFDFNIERVVASTNNDASATAVTDDITIEVVGSPSNTVLATISELTNVSNVVLTPSGASVSEGDELVIVFASNLYDDTGDTVKIQIDGIKT